VVGLPKFGNFAGQINDPALLDEYGRVVDARLHLVNVALVCVTVGGLLLPFMITLKDVHDSAWGAGLLCMAGGGTAGTAGAALHDDHQRTLLGGGTVAPCLV
jgi:hypothetical protein